MTEELGDRTIIAVKRTSSCCLDACNTIISLFLQKIHSGPRKLLQGRRGNRTIEEIHLSLAEIVYQSGPDLFSLPDNHCIAMLLCFMWHHRSMDASHDHRDTSRPKTIGNLICLRGMHGHGRQTNEIRPFIVVNRHDVFIGNLHFHVPRGQGRNSRETQLWKPKGTDILFVLLSPISSIFGLY